MTDDDETTNDVAAASLEERVPETSEHDDDFHVYASGHEEGNKPVPRWYILVVAVLGIFFVYYIATYLTGVQESAANFK